MPRKGEGRKREILPDPKYGDKVVAKFVNTIMGRGKKSVAESILYRSLDIVTARAKEVSLGIIKRPTMHTRHPEEVQSRLIVSAANQDAFEVRPKRRLSKNMDALMEA